MTDATEGSGRNLHMPAFVGRQSALEALDAALARAKRFRAPQFVTVLAPLGMGKTRFLGHWSAGLHDVTVVRATATCLPGSAEAEPFSLLASLLRSRFNLAETHDPAVALSMFRQQLQDVFGDRRVAEVAALMGRHLGFELPESPLGHALSCRPEQEIDLARAVLCRFLEEDARRKPVVLIVDDLHLADERSLTLLERLAAELGEAPLMLVAGARPELMARRPQWGRGEGSHARVELPPLSPGELDNFVRSILQAEALAPGLADRAAVESAGNPFLLEQLLQVYQQHGILVAETGSAWWFDVDRAGAETLELGPEAAAQARVSALSAAERDLLTRAAAFGSLFWTGGVVAMGRLGGEPLDATTVFAPDPSIDEIRRILEDLADRDYLVKLPASTINGETEWSFGQDSERALIINAIDPELMRRRHRFAAQWIEGRSGAQQIRPEWHEILGTLYEEGGDPRRAGLNLIAAGNEAQKRLRHDRARAFYLRGLRLLDVDDSIAKIDAYHKLGDVTARLGRMREALAHFGEMLKISWRLDLPAKGGAAHARIGRLHRELGDYKRSLQHFDLAHLLFELAGDRPGIAATLDDLGRVQFLRGDSEGSMSFHRAALTMREELKDQRGLALTLSWMGLVQSQAGDLAGALQHFSRALDIRRQRRDAHGVVASLLDLGTLERESGRAERAQKLLEEARTLARDMGERLYECLLAVQVGDCFLLRRRPAEAEQEFRAAKALALKFGARRLLAEADRGIAESRLAVGDALAAREHAHLGLTQAEAIGAPLVAGAALRVLASAVAAGAPGDSDRGGAREMFDRAVELLGSTGAELELGRTLSAYADFEERTGRDTAAIDLRSQARGIWDRAHAPAGPPAQLDS